MIGSLTHRFEIVIRPLRDKDGERQTVFLGARTAAQATREATARWPTMKVVSVSRAGERPAEIAVDHNDHVELRRVGT